MIQYCYSCGQERDVVPVVREDKLDVRGETITQKITYMRCTTCQTEYITPISQPGLKLVYDEYRCRKNLPSPEEILGLRNSLGMSREVFAFLMSVSIETLRRYETGALIWGEDAETFQKIQRLNENKEIS